MNYSTFQTSFILSNIISLAHFLGLYPILMPQVFPALEEVYLCTMVDFSDHATFWIRGFHPKVNSKIVHHAILAGCSERPPATRFNLWNCGGGKHTDPAYPSHPVCPPENGEKIRRFVKDTAIYVWAANGKPLRMPRDVGFEIAGNNKVKGRSYYDTFRIIGTFNMIFILPFSLGCVCISSRLYTETLRVEDLRCLLFVFIIYVVNQSLSYHWAGVPKPVLLWPRE